MNKNLENKGYALIFDYGKREILLIKKPSVDCIKEALNKYYGIDKKYLYLDNKISFWRTEYESDYGSCYDVVSYEDVLNAKSDEVLETFPIEGTEVKKGELSDYWSEQKIVGDYR